MTKRLEKVSWSFQNIWNESLEQRENWKLKPRNHIWASELGGAYIDRYYKMKGVVPSNPFDPRSLRKFEAGRIFEWIVEMVLKRAGILLSVQEWVEFQYPGLMRVTGKLDHLAGGKPNWDLVKEKLVANELPPFILRTALAVIKHFSEKYPNGLDNIILEIRSVGSFMFHSYKTFRMPDPKHSLQLFHYLKAKDMPEGHLVYISKDDLCIAEIGVKNPSSFEKDYEADISLMTGYPKKESPPPAEKCIIFDKIAGRFAVNWKVGYSQYLTKVYGFKNQNAFDKKFKPTVARWNRVLRRVVYGRMVTVDNKKALKEMKDKFPNINGLIGIAKERRRHAKTKQG